MDDDSEAPGGDDLAVVLRVEEVAWLGSWSVRISVAQGASVCDGWAPFVFWSRDAACAWLDARTSTVGRPTVRDCVSCPDDVACAAVVDHAGVEVLVSEPMPRVRAAGVAALFAAELGSHARR